MARPSWTGAITFAGFPINVRAYPLVKSRSAQSFKTLAPNGLPVQQVLVDSNGEPVERADTSKGVEVSKDKYAALDPAAVEMIQSAERSEFLDVIQFAPKSSVPLQLATGHFRLVPDEKVAGSAGPVNILWNGLTATERALVTEWVPRASSRDSLLVVHADIYGLTANTIPYVSELQDVPEWKPESDDKAQSTFQQFIEAQDYDLDDFAHAAHESNYEARRAAAIEAALKGEVIEAPTAPTPDAQAAPDLMAAMAGALDKAKPSGKKAPAKKRTKAKAAA